MCPPTYSTYTIQQCVHQPIVRILSNSVSTNLWYVYYPTVCPPTYSTYTIQQCVHQPIVHILTNSVSTKPIVHILTNSVSTKPIVRILNNSVSTNLWYTYYPTVCPPTYSTYTIKQCVHQPAGIFGQFLLICFSSFLVVILFEVQPVNAIDKST